MSVRLNHTIVWCKNQAASSRFLAEMLGRPEPTRFGPFHVVDLDNGVSLDFLQHDTPEPQHYAFLLSEAEFDEVFGRIRERGLDYWADPGQTKRGEINRRDGGRGCYFQDPDGHLLEILTRPYGSGA
jgi:catechol 2,3-dioxygenase-like lactoylglutathione lyase family enzyme